MDTNTNNNLNDKSGNHIDYFAPKILWFIIGILLLVVVVGSCAWWQEIKNEDQIREASNNTVVPADKSSDWKVYKNDRFGFELQFTDAWKGYRVFSAEGSQGVGKPYYLRFSVPTSDKTSCVQNITDQICGYAAPITVTVIAKVNEVSMQDGKLGSNQEYDYYYSLYTHFNELPDDLNKVNFEIPKVISTFKFTK